ncbi:MAG: hypothetical protein H8E94_00815 [Alphaproteobacteria bacterium]|nr:hypothetical protein [Alphaproteobacteria bacterium]
MTAGPAPAMAQHRHNLALAYGLAGRMEEAAAVSRRDLSEAQVKHNLAIYERLRGLSGSEREREILGRRDVAPAAP